MTILRVENLSKSYRLGVQNRRRFFADLRARLTGAASAAQGEEFWALRDVNFEVGQGEVVGILGSNGAGKSTLLKILSQITSPTRGRVCLGGRVASLLEVGTGFHQELTGRDNVFLNGTILGMTRREVASKFDEIADFAGVENFLDTPVKRYSSGMRVRLAFAVAAHLEPELLVIDEVLAVGDAAFQQKCLGKMGDVARSGRTILFVSHNAAAVQALCRRGIVLQNGQVRFDGTQTEALAEYAKLSGGARPSSAPEESTGARSGSGEVRITAVELRTGDGALIAAVRSGQDIELALRFECPAHARWPELCVRLHFETEFGTPVFVHFNDLTHATLTTASGTLPSRGAFICRLPRLPLAPAAYRVHTEVRTARRRGEVLDRLENALRLTVEKGDFFGTGELPNARLGPSLVAGSWRMEADTLHA